MKLKKKYISLLCMCSLAMSSCDSFLEEKPLDQKDSNQFWQTASDAETGVNALYFGGVPYLYNTGGGTCQCAEYDGRIECGNHQELCGSG